MNMPHCPSAVEEAKRLMSVAAARQIPVRVIGGVAVALHAAKGLPAPLRRQYADVDLVAPRKTAPEVLRFLDGMGYEANARFNAMNAYERLVVYHRATGRQIDVFVGEFRMCHTLPIAARLHLDAPTAPLAELVLTKMQIVELNAKDLQDLYGLVLEHDIGDNDVDVINGAYIGALLAKDWGLWRTSQGTLDAARLRLTESDLSERDQAVIGARLARLMDMVGAVPKSRRWRARARVGDRVRWYEAPEEVEHRLAERE